MGMIICCLLIILLAGFIYKAYKNTHRFTVNRIELASEYSGRPEKDLHILHLSDMHLEHISVTPNQMYEALKDEKIDLIALTGDFLDRKRSIPKLVPYLQKLNELGAPLGMYAVFGNHDYLLERGDFDGLRRVLHEHGCKTLINETDAVLFDGMRLNIIGIDDYCTGHSDLPASFSGVEEGYRLVLTHDPNVVLEMASYEYDYLLSGHFHGGQIHWPKPYHLASMGSLVRMNMIQGLHRWQGKPFYISEGLGQTGVNLRVGSRPEMTLHRIALSQEAAVKANMNTAVV